MTSIFILPSKVYQNMDAAQQIEIHIGLSNFKSIALNPLLTQVVWHILSVAYIQKSSKTKENSVVLVRSELFRPSDRRLLAKLVPTLADRRCRMVSATKLHSR
jgi:hypothetical protein